MKNTSSPALARTRARKLARKLAGKLAGKLALATFLAGSALIAASLLNPAAAQSMASPTQANATTGASLFASNCAACHGANGAGGKKFASGSVAADLQAPGLEKTYHGKDSLLLRAILDARDEDGDHLDHPMPAWRGRLSVAQAKDIIAYLHTLHS